MGLSSAVDTETASKQAIGHTPSMGDIPRTDTRTRTQSSSRQARQDSAATARVCPLVATEGSTDVVGIEST